MTPVIILLRPQLGENIGKAARAMLNFGLTDLRLVDPRDGWPNADAGPAASGADVVLERARVFDSLAEAAADCHQILATTVRPRGLAKPVLTPRAAAGQICTLAQQGGRTALLFGPERSGLETRDLMDARAIITVPVNPDFGSLNLAQAVILVAYEWFMTQSAIPDQRYDGPYEGPAPHGEQDAMIQHLFRALQGADYFHPAERTAILQRNLASMFARAGLTADEVRTLRGAIKALELAQQGGPIGKKSA